MVDFDSGRNLNLKYFICVHEHKKIILDFNMKYQYLFYTISDYTCLGIKIAQFTFGISIKTATSL